MCNSATRLNLAVRYWLLPIKRLRGMAFLILLSKFCITWLLFMRLFYFWLYHIMPSTFNVSSPLPYLLLTIWFKIFPMPFGFHFIASVRTGSLHSLMITFANSNSFFALSVFAYFL